MCFFCEEICVCSGLDAGDGDDILFPISHRLAVTACLLTAQSEVAAQRIPCR